MMQYGTITEFNGLFGKIQSSDGPARHLFIIPDFCRVLGPPSVGMKVAYILQPDGTSAWLVSPALTKADLADAVRAKVYTAVLAS